MKVSIVLDLTDLGSMALWQGLHRLWQKRRPDP